MHLSFDLMMITTRQLFNISAADPSWQPCLQEALKKIDPAYLERLYCNSNWLPGPQHIFNAFSLPIEKTRFVLFGESPYPRFQSANGYAFWDAAVHEIWSNTGLSTQVNRATSLRNIIKMLLIAEGLLQPNQTSQLDIAKLDKQSLVKTNEDLFQNFLQQGFLLLNATPVFQFSAVHKDARAWHPFIKYILEFLFQQQPSVQLILFGKIAQVIDSFITHHQAAKLYTEHPYNISFINRPEVLQFFRPLHLIKNKDKAGAT